MSGINYLLELSSSSQWNIFCDGSFRHNNSWLLRSHSGFLKSSELSRETCSTLQLQGEFLIQVSNEIVSENITMFCRCYWLCFLSVHLKFESFYLRSFQLSSTNLETQSEVMLFPPISHVFRP